jgi:hypothetical protein
MRQSGFSFLARFNVFELLQKRFRKRFLFYFISLGRMGGGHGTQGREAFLELLEVEG